MIVNNCATAHVFDLNSVLQVGQEIVALDDRGDKIEGVKPATGVVIGVIPNQAMIALGIGEIGKANSVAVIGENAIVEEIYFIGKAAGAIDGYAIAFAVGNPAVIHPGIGGVVKEDPVAGGILGFVPIDFDIANLEITGEA